MRRGVRNREHESLERHDGLGRYERGPIDCGGDLAIGPAGG